MRNNACPRCSCSLKEPYEGPDEDGHGDITDEKVADQKCGHCGVEIKWVKTWVAEYKEPYDKFGRW